MVLPRVLILVFISSCFVAVLECFYPFPLFLLPPMCSFLSLAQTFSLTPFSCSHSFNHSSHLNQVSLMCISIHRHLKLNKTETEIIFLSKLHLLMYSSSFFYKRHYPTYWCSPSLHSSWYCLSPQPQHIWAHQLQCCSNSLSISSLPSIPFSIA